MEARFGQFGRPLKVSRGQATIFSGPSAMEFTTGPRKPDMTLVSLCTSFNREIWARLAIPLHLIVRRNLSSVS